MSSPGTALCRGTVYAGVRPEFGEPCLCLCPQKEDGADFRPGMEQVLEYLPDCTGGYET